MKIVLQGAEIEDYFKLRDLDRKHQEMLQAIQQFTTSVLQSHHQLEVHLSELGQQLAAQLTGLREQVAAAKEKILSTVQAETQEDVEQNARLAEKQAALDTALAKITELEGQVAGALTAEEAAPLQQQLIELQQEVIALATSSVVTDPNASSEPAP